MKTFEYRPKHLVLTLATVILAWDASIIVARPSWSQPERMTSYDDTEFMLNDEVPIDEIDDYGQVIYPSGDSSSPPVQSLGALEGNMPRNDNIDGAPGAQRESGQQKIPTAKRVETSELRYATPVEGKVGFVYSPGRAHVMANILDVRGLPSGMKARDPNTGRVFFVP